MKSKDDPEAFRSVIADAIGSLSESRSRTTNLYLDTRAFERDELVGPTFQDIRTRQRCLVVFVDEHPRANFGHSCRYRFYDAKNHRFLYETPAAFPPYVDFIPKTFFAIHKAVEPVLGSYERRSHRHRPA
jgi:hypothetical protein